MLSLMHGCGGGSSSGSSGISEEDNTETTDRNDVAVQGTIWNFRSFQNADGSSIDADQSNADNFIYLAPFTDSFRGNYGCASVSGTYTLNGNDLSVTETQNTPEECDSTGANYESNLALTKRVLDGPSTISVSNNILTLMSATNESLVLVAAQEE